MSFQTATVSIGHNTKKSDYDTVMDNTQYNKTQTTLASKGKADITIDEYDTDAAPDVKSGSVFDNNGVIIEIISDATPSGYSGISNSTTFYLYWDEDPGAFIYSSTVPTWSDAKQGWYNGLDRAFFSMFKDSGGTLYQNKSLMINLSDGQIGTLVVNDGIDVGNNGVYLKTKVFNAIIISPASSETINHGLTDEDDIKGISGVIHSSTIYITHYRLFPTSITFNFSAPYTGFFSASIIYEV